MTNPDAIVATHAKATGTGLYTLIGTRIYLPDLPTGYDNTQACVLVYRRGGNGESYTNKVIHPSYQIRCYGGSTKISDAEAVALAFYERFNGKHMTQNAAGRIIHVSVSFPQGAQREPDSGYPVAYLTMELTTTA